VIVPPQIRGNLPVRSCWLLSGLFLFAFGIVLIYQSRLGLSPWDVLNQGLSRHSPLSFGSANIAIALALLVVARRLKVRIGPGTIANAILIGLFIDLLLRLESINSLSRLSIVARSCLLAGGIAVIGIGSALYIGANLGAGPRDSVMLGLSQLIGVRIGAIRGVLEAAVTAGGFALGGTVGVGTLAFAVGIGPAVEASYILLARSPLAKQQPRGHAPLCSARGGGAYSGGGPWVRRWTQRTRGLEPDSV
jgi:uncharacterized protein